MTDIIHYYYHFPVSKPPIISLSTAYLHLQIAGFLGISIFFFFVMRGNCKHLKDSWSSYPWTFSHLKQIHLPLFFILIEVLKMLSIFISTLNRTISPYALPSSSIKCIFWASPFNLPILDAVDCLQDCKER